jgi:hypothetical protein
LLLYSSITGEFIITCRRLSPRLFSRQETPSLSIPTLSAAFLVRTFAASSVPPIRGAPANSRTGWGTASDVRRFAQSRMALGGRGRLPVPATIVDFLVWTWEIRAQKRSFGEAQNRCAYPGEEMKPRRRLISNRRRSVNSRSHWQPLWMPSRKAPNCGIKHPASFRHGDESALL